MERKNKSKSTKSSQEWTENISLDVWLFYQAGTLDWMRKSKKRSAMIPKSYA